MNNYLVLLLVLVAAFTVQGCGEDQQAAILKAAQAEISFWRWMAIIGCGVALLIGVVLGLKSRS